MLLTRLIHPEILSELGRSGHGTRILIADGNFPFTTESPREARKVYLNLRRGLVQAMDVLEVIVHSVPIESAILMAPPDGVPVEIHDEYKAILNPDVAIQAVKRLDFYREVRSSSTALVIATGEGRRFANILLTIGVVR
ncbi:MAG: RbsD/FucU family protein [Verrucomicrobiota bacterium]